MKVFFQLFGQRKDIEQMFDEEEPKKIKPIDLDDLSVEEIEEMIGNHKLEIKNLEILLGYGNYIKQNALDIYHQENMK